MASLTLHLFIYIIINARNLKTCISVHQSITMVLAKKLNKFIKTEAISEFIEIAYF